VKKAKPVRFYTLVLEPLDELRAPAVDSVRL
jgi:hypothetical protein